MSGFLSGLWSSNRSDDAQHSKSTRPFTAELVAQTLRPFGISEPELEYLGTIITTPVALEQTLTSLKSNRRTMLERQIGPLLDKWASATKQERLLLLACQSLVGTAAVHPVFEPVAGLLNVCDGFGDLLLRQVDQTARNKQYSLSLAVRDSQDLVLTVTESGELKVDCSSIRSSVQTSSRRQTRFPGNNMTAEERFRRGWWGREELPPSTYQLESGRSREYKLSFAAVEGARERDFWVQFGRKMTERTLLSKQTVESSCADDERRYRVELSCTADAGAFATFASQVAGSGIGEGDQAAGLSAVSEAAARSSADGEAATAALVAERLRPFTLAESELQYLSRFIAAQALLQNQKSAPQELLESLIVSLRSNRRITLAKRVLELASLWEEKNKQDRRILLACQDLVGMEVVHPVFEPVAGLLNVCQGFGDLLTKLLLERDSSVVLQFDANQDLALSCGLMSPETVTLSFPVAFGKGEREFWLRFARKMTEKLLKADFDLSSKVVCAADAGSFITFASRMTQSDTSSALSASGGTERLGLPLSRINF